MTDLVPSIGPQGARAIGDAVTLSLKRVFNGYADQLIVDADGRVTAAFAMNTRMCNASGGTLSSKHALYRMSISGTNDVGAGAIAINYDDGSLRTIVPYEGSIKRGFVGGDPGVVAQYENAYLELYDWNGAVVGRVPNPEQDDLPVHHPAWFNDELIWSSSTLFVHREKMWSKAGGSRSFFSGDPSRAPAELGMDDTIMAWVEGYRVPGSTNNEFDEVRLYAAPRNHESAAKLLRADQTLALGANRMVVGCGRVARTSYWKRSGKVEEVLLVAQVANGRATGIPSALDSAFRWGEPLAMTCRELFVSVYQIVEGVPHANVARISLADLGDGEVSDVDAGSF